MHYLCVCVRPEMMSWVLVVSINTDQSKQSDLYMQRLHIGAQRLNKDIDFHGHFLSSNSLTVFLA